MGLCGLWAVRVPVRVLGVCAIAAALAAAALAAALAAAALAATAHAATSRTVRCVPSRVQDACSVASTLIRSAVSNESGAGLNHYFWSKPRTLV